jgi:hypothetical protein
MSIEKSPKTSMSIQNMYKVVTRSEEIGLTSYSTPKQYFDYH